jgi:membrane protease YdiL (CAAX protease family)
LSLRAADLLGIALFLALWGGSVAYLAATGGDWTFPFISLGVFGLGLSAIALFTTRGATLPPVPVARPAIESAAVLVYLALYAIAFLGWGLGFARAAFPPGPAQEVFVLALKLGVHVALPALLLLSFGSSLAPLWRSDARTPWFWRTLVVLGAVILALLAVVSPSLENVQALEPTWTLLVWAAPASFVWMALEAGLCEEFLYRAVVQTRLTALSGSAWVGVAATSVLFGLAHAPGLYLRGGPGVDGWSTDVWQVIAYTLSTLAPLSLTFGFIYARTKSLLLVVLLHACVDVLPNLSEFIKIWRPS